VFRYFLFEPRRNLAILHPRPLIDLKSIRGQISQRVGEELFYLSRFVSRNQTATLARVTSPGKQ
jgi:hypothetical protein